MIIGVTRVCLLLPGNNTLKGKRSIVRKMLDRVRARFHVSCAEVEDQESHQRAVLGFCTVGADGRKIEQVLDRLVEFVEDTGLGQVVSCETDMVSYDEIVGGFEIESYASKYGLGQDEPAFGTGDRVSGDERSDSSGRRMKIKPGSLGYGSSGTKGDE